MVSSFLEDNPPELISRCEDSKGDQAKAAYIRRLADCSRAVDDSKDVEAKTKRRASNLRSKLRSDQSWKLH